MGQSQTFTDTIGGVEVTFARRPDGGLQAWCDKVPGFFLSHSDPAMVFSDVEPALTTLMAAAPHDWSFE